MSESVAAERHGLTVSARVGEHPNLVNKPVLSHRTASYHHLLICAIDPHKRYGVGRAGSA